MKSNTFSQFLFLVFASLSISLFTGCSAATPSAVYRDQGLAPQPASAPSQSNAGKPAAGGTGSDKSATVNLDNRLIVRNASLTLIVDDTQARVEALTKLVNDAGGFVAASSSTKYDAGVQSRLTVRVPSEKFDESMNGIRKQATEVRDESISGEDVTAEYTDLNSQLTNLEAAELQLRDIMSKTDKTDDVLSVYNALTQKRGEIEQVKGRIQYLTRSVAMATINISLIPDKMAQPVSVAGWHPEGVAKSAIEALISALQGIASITIWLIIVILPVVLVLASPFIVLGMLIRSRNRRRKALIAKAAQPAIPADSSNSPNGKS